MAERLRDWRIIEAGQHTREIQTTKEIHHELDQTLLAELAEKIREHYEDLQRDIDKCLSYFDGLKGRIEVLENRPPPLPIKMANDPQPIPRAIGDLTEGLSAAEKQLNAVLERLEVLESPERVEAIRDLNQAVLMHFQQFREDIENLRARMQAQENKWHSIPALARELRAKGA